ncbi:DUF2339 domain-containing protein [Pyxidicoccus parkwayensis]|uniref:DUF2339 domain-containing protein n=1 Tax=Pyxidicoccus parkwayensis TaxID=2813578 RepID=A0ABX7NL73_9BACT|nr:DUF2339 domain-containing protein [Pyxidicoccus parkwaysis]QSQ19602.1 DUF2339 domain-containing protein [Pyxidicoccus parkwaysis]
MHTTTKWDVKVLGGVGGGLLALAVVFLWSDLQVPREWLLAVAAVGAAGLAFVDVPRTRGLLGPIAVLACSAAGGLWYAATKQEALLVGLALTLGVAAITVWRAGARAAEASERVRNVVVWYGFTAAAVAASWAFYFHFLTLGIAEDNVARRLVLTLGWLVVGVALVLTARQRGTPVMRDAGFGFVAIAVGKALLYDTVNLHGSLRVAGLAAAGALLVGAALLSSRTSESPSRSA